MKKPPASAKAVRKLRCAVYTRKSTEEGLDMEFNSLDAQSAIPATKSAPPPAAIYPARLLRVGSINRHKQRTKHND